MERMEDLLKVRPEEREAAAAEYEAAAVGAEYSQALAFAGLQLRARALEGAAWSAYSLQVGIERAVRAFVDRHESGCPMETRLAMYDDLEQLGTETMTRFTLWRDVEALAWADGRERLTPEKAAQGLAAVAWLEQANADTLLNRQNTAREGRANEGRAEECAKIEKEVSA